VECPKSISMNGNEAEKGDMPQNKSSCPPIQHENETGLFPEREREIQTSGVEIKLNECKVLATLMYRDLIRLFLHFLCIHNVSHQSAC